MQDMVILGRVTCISFLLPGFTFRTNPTFIIASRGCFFLVGVLGLSFSNYGSARGWPVYLCLGVNVLPRRKRVK